MNTELAEKCLEIFTSYSIFCLRYLFFVENFKNIFSQIWSLITMSNLSMLFLDAWASQEPMVSVPLQPLHNVWLCMTNVWLCMTMYDYVWLCMTMSDYVWLCMTMYDYVWLCMNMYDYILTLFDSLQLCMPMYEIL